MAFRASQPRGSSERIRRLSVGSGCFGVRSSTQLPSASFGCAGFRKRTVNSARRRPSPARKRPAAAARISASAATTFIMPPLYTRVTAVPERVPAILALDFDGVLCDGMREYFTAAWRAWRRLRPSIALNPPSGLFERFARVRPVVESGWEMPLVIMALLAGAAESELLERWRPAPLLAELRLAREAGAAPGHPGRGEGVGRHEDDRLRHQHIFSRDL